MAEMLRANAEEMRQFVTAMFCHADEDSYVSLRAFAQNTQNSAPVEIRAIKLGDHKRLLEEATRVANIAANSLEAAVFAPPVATFSNSHHARHIDIQNGVALSVELDAGDTTAARQRLEHILGPVTICMASGSEWMDEQSGEFHPKVHLHWRLSEPTRTMAEHNILREARRLAALLVGADESCIPPCHPLRWPGSWNTKRTPKMARITVGNQSSEIHLHDALERLQDAIEGAGLDATPAEEHVPGQPQAPLPLITQALEAIPNAEVSWDAWNAMGMATYAATGGSSEGLLAWADWSAKSKKHEEVACSDRWTHYGSSPPSRIGAGSIFFLAKKEGWIRPGREEPEAPPTYSEEAWQSLMDQHADHTGEAAHETNGDNSQAEPITDQDKSIPDPRLYNLLWFEDIQPVRNVLDFVQGVLIEGSAAIVFGESNAGKTFWTTDLALHIAAGKRWNDRRVEQGAVIYCTLEGGSGFKNRVHAWKMRHGFIGKHIPFAAIQSSVNLLDPMADAQKLISTIKAAALLVSMPVKLVVVDTVARAMAGGNENAPDDMGAFVRSMDMIREETTACVMGIHHSGKDQSKGSRGHSSLRAAIDTEIEVVAEEGSETKVATVLKQRELKKGDIFNFTLEVVELGPNRHSEQVTTCAVVHSENQYGRAAEVRTRLRGHNLRAFEVLSNLIAASGAGDYAGTPSGSSSVPEKWWRERFYTDAMPGDTPEAKKKAFGRASAALIEFKKVAMANNRVWIPSLVRGHFGGQNDGTEGTE